MDDFKNDGTVMFSDFVVVALDEIMKTSKPKPTSRVLKSLWRKWVTDVAIETGVTVDFTLDNWFIVDKRLQKSVNQFTTTAASTYSKQHFIIISIQQQEGNTINSK